MVLMGQDGDETRKLVLLVNHSILDADSILIWLGQILKNLNDPEAMQVSVRAEFCLAVGRSEV
jgi:hypothetical protein